MKMILKIISNTLVVFTVVLAILLCGTQLVGLKPYSVLSGSMQSVYPTGAIIYVKDVEPACLEINDVITFKTSDSTIVTHRIIDIVEDEVNPDIVRFKTKGDENDIADGQLVEYDEVIGKVLFGIPYLGFLATYMAKPYGKIVAICFGIALILIEIIIGILLDDESDKSEKEKV